MISLLSLLLGGPVFAWVRIVYTRLSSTNDRAPFRPKRAGNFPVAADETRICFAALCIRGYKMVMGGLVCTTFAAKLFLEATDSALRVCIYEILILDPCTGLDPLAVTRTYSIQQVAPPNF
jgi:hypothetical protein